MTVTINAASAGIDLSVGEARADVALGNNVVIFHLTKGFSLIRVEDIGLEPDPAFQGLGHFTLSLGPRDTLKGWDFGFIQLAKLNAGAAFYAGRIRNEGSISVLFRNAMPAFLLLDSRTDRTPFTQPKGLQFQRNGNTITCGTQDHPALKVPRELRNSGRNVNNFLFQVVDDREFWSVLSVSDPQDQKKYLAHFHWQISNDVTFAWRDGKPVVTKKRCRFTVLGQGKGAPADAELQGLLANPVPPQFNETAQNAVVQAFRGARGPNRTENNTWFVNVPPDFFT
jgi:hypothetical protein